MNAKECQRAIKGDFSGIQDFTGIHDLRTVNTRRNLRQLLENFLIATLSSER